MIISPENVHLEIDGMKVRGVANLSFENDNSLTTVSFAGLNKFGKTQSSVVIPRLSFSRKDYGVSEDYMKYLTGNSYCDGRFIYKYGTGYKEVAFSGAYLSKYACSVSKDTSPTYSYSLSIFGGAEDSDNSEFEFGDMYLSPPERSNVTLSSSRFSGFVAEGVNYEMEINRIPVFSLRGMQFSDIKRILPINVSMSVKYFAKEVTSDMFSYMQRYGESPTDILAFEVKSEHGATKDFYSGVAYVDSDEISVSTENEVFIDSRYNYFIT